MRRAIAEPEPRRPAGVSAPDRAAAELVARLLGWGLRMRLVVGPVVFGAFGLAALLDGARGQALALGLSGAALAGWSLHEARAYRSGRMRHLGGVSLAVLVAAPNVLVLLTGGLQSPMIIVALPICIVVPLAVPGRAGLAGVAAQVALVWVFAALEHVGPSAPLVLGALGGTLRPEHPLARTVAQAVVLTVTSLVATRLGRTVARAVRQTVDEAVSARDETLATYAEQSATLTALSAEIAHELKNPLASIKGLGALVARDVEGKTAERVGVLRREVDRVQSVLEELLVFARPVVPLSLAEVDLAELVREVGALHEGLAAERAVSVVVEAPGPVVARCDDRKVKQVLVNLVQNALQASSEGGAITLAASREGQDARVHVRDRGAGLPAELGERLFQAGVSLRDGGSGLGLTIARTLARQHGGEVTLRARGEGGCEAELRLPAGGPVVEDPA